MSRRRFTRTISIGAAGLGAVATGLSGAARAAGLVIPEHVAGGGDNYNVWPSGDTTGLTDTDSLQFAVDSVRDGGCVRLHGHDKPSSIPKEFHLGTGTVKILDKSVTIIGSPNQNSNNNPVINGASDGLMGGPDGPANIDSGVFHVKAPGKSVVFQNLDIRHVFAAGGSTYGSGTIIDSGSSLFHVIDCDILTSATSAIPIRGYPGEEVTGEVVVTGCKVKGLPFNYSSVNTGFGVPDFRDGGYLEVSGCQLDSAYFVGVAILGMQSDSSSAFNVSGNAIGHDPTLTGDPNTTAATSFGIFVGFYSFPLGNLEIADNTVRLDRYYVLARASGGIVLYVLNANPSASLTTRVSNNEIILNHDDPPVPVPMLPYDGIVYEDLAPTFTPLRKSFNVSVEVDGNRINTPKHSAKRGITLGVVDAFLGGQESGAAETYVHDNDYSSLNASIAKVFLGSKSLDNTVNEPTLTCADIDDNGTNNQVAAGGVSC